MSSSLLQVAKREWHDFRSTRPAWVATLAAGILIGLAGPFGTDEVMRLIPRVLYWMFLAVLTYVTGTILDAALRPALQKRLPVWGAIPLVSVVTAAAITLQITVINALMLQFVPGPMGLATLYGNVLAASLVISTAAAMMAAPREAPVPAQTITEPAPPRLLARLPLAKRGGLIALSAVDHYVEVKTRAGTELVLMRLADAIAETHPVQGLQIHRSHWVALGAITDVQRAKGKTSVQLSDGQVLPVSRSKTPLLKEAGLLPEGASHA